MVPETAIAAPRASVARARTVLVIVFPGGEGLNMMRTLVDEAVDDEKPARENLLNL
jgi:hypothetical protein